MKDSLPQLPGASPPGDPLQGGLSELAQLVADCLERVDREGSSAVDEICAQHPEHADELRRRLSALRDVGLLGVGRLGPYELLRTLGQGGMGLVYLARDERLNRLVALKALPNRLTAKPRSLERFQREIRTAAQLQHPRIVPIYDVGEVDGVPYFTMEYVEGRTLADVVRGLADLGLPADRLRGSHLAQAAFGSDATGDDETPLPQGWSESAIETSCRLVLDVADALAYAHDQGVVHRDVKPSNVLVRLDGRAQLFDFGLARLETDESMTISGDFTGTPFYVSPEQIAARRKSVDARSDVYSLGVTLYELLTLQRPFTGETTQEVFRQVLGREPPPPGRYNESLPRDLQTICLTALEKDKGRRYQSVVELADDLRRFLSYRPVNARPVGVGQRLLRRARRNPAASLAIVLALVLVTGAPIGLWMANVAIRSERDEAERQRVLAEAEGARAVIAAERASVSQAVAEREAAHAAQEQARAQQAADVAAEQTLAALDARALAEDQRHAAQASLRKVEAVNALIMDILAAPAPLLGGHEVTVLEVLDKAAASLADRLADDPAVEAAMRNTLAITYRQLGMRTQASEQLELAYELVAAHPEIDADGQASTFINRAVMLGREDRIDEAWELMQRGLALRRQVSDGANDPRLADALNNLSYLQQRRGDPNAALETLEEVRSLRVAMFGAESRQVVETLVNMAYMTGRAGDDAREIELLEQAMELGRQLPPPDDLVIITAGNNLALNLSIAQRKHEAVPIYEECLAMALQRLGADHRSVADARLGMSFILRDLREYDQVAEHLPEAIRIYRDLEPQGSPRLAKAMHHLGEAVYHQGDEDAAMAWFEESLAMRRELFPATHEDVGGVMADIVTLLNRQRRFERARDVLTEFELIYREAGPPSLEQHLACLTALAQVCEKLGDDEGAAGWREQHDRVGGALAP